VKLKINFFIKMSTNLSFNAFQEIMEPPKCRVICMVNGIGDSGQQMRLLRLQQSLNICVDDFNSYIIEARYSGFIKFDPINTGSSGIFECLEIIYFFQIFL
jgi:hypothetical protein